MRGGWSLIVFPRCRQDAAYFLLGANSIMAGTGLAIWCAVRRRRAPPLAVMLTLGYPAALLGFILFAYITRCQPVLLPRYGLIFFALGLPLLMYLIQFLIKQ